MTSFRQIEANRRNALKSTGPRTEAGKQISRCNAVRHGLTAATVIGAFEDAGDYQQFETTVMADYDAQSAVERALVLRLDHLDELMLREVERRAKRVRPARNHEAEWDAGGVGSFKGRNQRQAS